MPEHKRKLIALATEMPAMNGKWSRIAKAMEELTGIVASSEEWRRQYRYWTYEAAASDFYKTNTKEIREEDLQSYLERQGKYFPFSLSKLQEEKGWENAEEILFKLRKQGCPVIQLTADTWVYSRGKEIGGTVLGKTPSHEDGWDTHHCTVGIWADPHFGHTAQQPTIMRKLYDRFRAIGVDAVMCAGDLLEGIYPSRPEHEMEIFAHGLDAQMAVAKDAMRGLDFVTTYLIGSNHPFTFMKHGGVNASRRAESDIPGIKYVSDIVGDIWLRSWLRVRMWHPDGGGTPDDPFKSVRKYIKSLPVTNRPHVIIVGHYHKLGYECIDGIHCFMAGSCVGSTHFATANNLRYELGGWTAGFSKGADGRVEVNFIIPHRYDQAKEGDFDANIAYSQAQGEEAKTR